MDFKLLEEKLEKTILGLSEELSKIHANRVSVASLKGIIVMIDEAKFAITDLAVVRVINAQMLGIKCWDSRNNGPIEKAIRAANLGLMVGSKDDELSVSFPELTQDRRKEIAKSLNTYSVNVKNAVRFLRNDFMKLNKKGSKEEEVKQDKEVQKLIDKINSKIDELIERKQKEVMSN